MSRELETRPPGEVDPRMRGYALPSVLAALVTLTLLGLAAFQSARLDSHASSSLVASIRAFYAAEAGLVLLEADRPAGVDSVTIPAVRIETSREDILRLSDGGRLVRLAAEAVLAGPSGAVEARRRVSSLRLIPSGDAGRRLAGSWRETIRP